jgi:hypothetical protein
VAFAAVYSADGVVSNAVIMCSTVLLLVSLMAVVAARTSLPKQLVQRRPRRA